MNNPGKPSILFVCTANIIRSPIAEAMLKTRIRRHQLFAGWHVASAGVYGLKNEPADATAQVVMNGWGYDLSSHVSRKVRTSLVSQADLVLTMEKGQKEILLAAYPREKDRIKFLGEITGKDEDVFDPIGGTREAYETAIDNINRMIEQSFLWIVVFAKYHHDISGGKEGTQPRTLQVPAGYRDEVDFPKMVLDVISEISPVIKYGILYLLLQILPDARVLRKEIESLSREVPPTKEEENWLVRMRLFEIVRPRTCLQSLRADIYRHPDIEKKVAPMINRLENPARRQLFEDLEQLYARNLPAFKYRLGIWDLKTKYPDLPYRIGDYEEAYTILRK